LRVY